MGQSFLYESVRHELEFRWDFKIFTPNNIKKNFWLNTVKFDNSNPIEAFQL